MFFIRNTNTELSMDIFLLVMYLIHTNFLVPYWASVFRKPAVTFRLYTRYTTHNEKFTSTRSFNT
jgi:hypothetical protein